MAWALPRLLRRVGAALVAHAVRRSRCAAPCPAVVTIHDLSFERDSAAHGR